MIDVWSERGETPWRDCWACGYLMALVASGFRKFPLGAYTVSEREAYERSQTMFPPEVGGNNAANDQASLNRYGIKLPPSTIRGAEYRLQEAGKAYVVAGKMGNFPAGSPIRRWDPAFTGNHMVCIIPKGDGTVLWLDPLAPMHFAGDTYPAAMVSTFMIGMADQTRVATLVKDIMLKPMKFEGWKAKTGAVVTDYPGGTPIAQPVAGTELTTLGESPDGTYRAVWITTGGVDVVGYIRRDMMDALVPGGDPAFDQSVRDLLMARAAPTKKTVTITGSDLEVVAD